MTSTIRFLILLAIVSAILLQTVHSDDNTGTLWHYHSKQITVGIVVIAFILTTFFHFFLLPVRS